MLAQMRPSELGMWTTFYGIDEKRGELVPREFKSQPQGLAASLRNFLMARPKKKG